MSTTATPTQAPTHASSGSPRRWFLIVVTAIVVAHAAKYPAMRGFLDANLHRGPDTSDVPADLVSSALSVGAVLGLLLSALIGALVAGLVHRRASRLTHPGLRSVVGLPYWLSGVLLVGLVVPDLVSATTGVIYVTGSAVFYAVYLPVAAVAVVLAPRPTDRRLRAVDVLLVAVLPFI